MGQFRSTFQSPFSAKISDRAHAPAKAAAPAPIVKRATGKVRKVPVTNTGAVTNAARQSRWRSKQDAVALRGQAQERMKGLRARRKAVDS